MLPMLKLSPAVIEKTNETVAGISSASVLSLLAHKMKNDPCLSTLEAISLPVPPIGCLTH